MTPAKKTISDITTELHDLIETFVADRFTVMDDSVIDQLYADLPDATYLKGIVKGMRRNLARQAADVNLESMYPKINAGSMAEALEQAKQQSVNVEDLYPKNPIMVNKTLTLENVSEVLRQQYPDKTPDQIVKEAAQILTANNQETVKPLSLPELLVLCSGMKFDQPQLHEKSHETGDDDWEDDSVQPAKLLEQDPTATHRVPTTREFLEPHFNRVGLGQHNQRSGSVERDTKASSDVEKPVSDEPQVERNFRSNLSRYGIAQATLADLASKARPGSLLSADTLKHSKQKDLLLVRSPATQQRKPIQLLESTDPQYYQYMWMAFEEALRIILEDDSLPNNQARRLDDELLIDRFAVNTASAAQALTSIGNRDLLHVENVNTCIRLLTDNFPSVKLYTGDKVMEGGVWSKTWTHTTLKTPKGRFVFGDEGDNVVWQTS